MDHVQAKRLLVHRLRQHYGIDAECVADALLEYEEIITPARERIEARLEQECGRPISIATAGVIAVAAGGDLQEATELRALIQRHIEGDPDAE